jgi:ribosomal-protein-serine acetyltransferase
MFSYKIDADLELRLPEERHAEEASELVRQNIQHLKMWLPWVGDDYSLEDAQNFIRHNLQQFADNKGFAVQLVFRNRIAGYAGYNTIDLHNRKAEIGYWLGAAFEGRGLMTKACQALVDYGFHELKLNRIEMQCSTHNSRSRRIPERLGFTQEGVLRQAEWVHDHFNDLVVYAMLAHEWQAKNQF